jgi:hypothetical protein
VACELVELDEVSASLLANHAGEQLLSRRDRCSDVLGTASGQPRIASAESWQRSAGLSACHHVCLAMAGLAAQLEVAECVAARPTCPRAPVEVTPRTDAGTEGRNASRSTASTSSTAPRSARLEAPGTARPSGSSSSSTRGAAALFASCFTLPARTLHARCDGPRYRVRSSSWSKSHAWPGRIGWPQREHAALPAATSAATRFLSA